MVLTSKIYTWQNIFVYWGPKKWHTFKGNQSFEYREYKELIENILSNRFKIRYENIFEKRLLISIMFKDFDKSSYQQIK